MYNSLSEFYTSKQWRNLRGLLIAARTNKKDGILYCEFSGKPLVKQYDIVAHHKIPLTTQNVNDASVSLNPSNIMLVSQQAHNEIHARFGYGTGRKVYIVHGAPCSGKTTFVLGAKGNSDIVIDMDSIWQCITGAERYVKPDALKQVAFATQQCLLDCVKRRTGNWERAWIIADLPFRTPREERAKQCGGELIHIDTDMETCIERLYNTNDRPHAAWEKYIRDYFSKYQD